MASEKQTEVQGARSAHTALSERFAVPAKVTGLDLAFGGDIGKLMPSYSEVPEEFKRGHTKWNDFVSAWFFSGVTNIRGVKDGIDKAEALNHIGAVLRSFEPKHEHKEAGCAYLASLWFPNIEWDKAKPKATP